MDNAQVSGNTLLDISGNSHTATMVNTPTTGAVGQVNEAVDFDSSSSEYATVVDHADFQGTTMALSAWINVPDLSGFGVIAQSQNNTPNQAGWLLIINADKIRAQIGGNVGAGTTKGTHLEFIDSPSLLTAGNLHHVGMDFSGSEILVIIDGFIAGRIDWSDIGYNATNFVQIAARNGNGTISTFANSIVDEIKYYDRGLEPAEWAGLFVDAGGVLSRPADGWLDADDPVIITPTVDDVIEAFVVLNDTGVEATSPILFYANSGLGLPATVETTGNLTVQLGASGIAKL